MPATDQPSAAPPAKSATAASEDSSPAPTAPSSDAAAATNPSSLYVGELDPAVTEALLFQIFNMIGSVQSIRVCRDAQTRRSLGYAYVNFNEPADAAKALEELNYSAIRGRPCRIMFSQRDPGLRRTGAGNIFIKNLDESIDNKTLHDTFSAFGKILSCKVATNARGQSLGYGFVHYDTNEAADQAIEHVNGMLINDKKVYVGHHIPKKERMAKNEEAKARFTNVYVKNLGVETTDEEFETLFGKFGEITSWHLAKNDEGKPVGFGFINYAAHDAAQAAVEALNDTELRGQTLFVARAQKKTEREAELRRNYELARNERQSQLQGVNLYLKNLPEDFDEERLQAAFSAFGTITSTKVMREPTGVSRGFGFVCFSTPDEANKAIIEMNGKMVSNKPLYVAHAQPREARRQQLEVQMLQRQQLRLQQQASQGIGYGMPSMYYGQPFAGQPGAPATALAAAAAVRGGGGVRFPPGTVPQGVPLPQYYHSPPGTRAGQYTAGPGGGAIPPMAYGGRAPLEGAPRALQDAWPVGSGAGLGELPRDGGGAAGGGIGGGAAARGVPGAGVSSVPSGAAEVPGVLDTSVLAAVPMEEQKQMLGEALYPQIAETQPELAGKLTGMLLEMPVEELLHLVENRAALDAKVDEGLGVLHEHVAAAAAAAAGPAGPAPAAKASA